MMDDELVLKAVMVEGGSEERIEIYTESAATLLQMFPIPAKSSKLYRAPNIYLIEKTLPG